MHVVKGALRILGIALVATGLGVIAGEFAYNGVAQSGADFYFHDAYIVLVDPELFLQPLGAGIAALVASRLCRGRGSSDSLSS